MKTQFGWAFPDEDVFMMNEIKPDGGYQRSHLTMALQYVTDWTISGDIGAHVGTWSRLMSPVFQQVIAVEPSADTFEALATNMRRFGCANVELKNVAVGDVPGRVSMVLDGRGLELKNTGARHTGIGKDIAVETIDSWNLPSLGFLKLDIEGSEFVALRGARQTLMRCKPIVLFEDKKLWHKFYGVPKNGVEVFLSSLGYHEVARASMDAIWAPA